MYNIWIELKCNVKTLSLTLLLISLLSRFLLIPPHNYCSLPVSSLFYIYFNLTFMGTIAKITISLTFPRHSLHDIGNLSEKWKADSVMTCLQLKKKKILLTPIHFRIISKLLRNMPPTLTTQTLFINSTIFYCSNIASIVLSFFDHFMSSSIYSIISEEWAQTYLLDKLKDK